MEFERTGMNDLLTVKQAAEYLQVHPLTINRHLNAGKIPGRKVGSRWRIRRADLEEFTAGKLTPQEQADLWRTVREQAESEIPKPTLLTVPSPDEAINKALAEIGYEGKEEQFWADIAPVAPDDELMQRYRAAVAELPDEDRELIRAADEAHAFNHRVKESWSKRVNARADELLAAKGYERTPHPAEELLRPLGKEKEELESASAAKLPRSRA